MDKSAWSKDRELFRSILKSCRIEAGITQSELAMRLNMAQSYVSKIENGERKVDVVEFILIAEAMNANVQSILNQYMHKRSIKLN